VPRNDLIQLRSDTAANWVSVNPTLAVGETGFETDTGKLKVGTGSSDWNSLIYVTDASDLAGIIPSARISGSYTGITGVGTLTSLTIDGPGSPSFTLGDAGFAGYSGITGDKGYLLVGNSVSDPTIYLRSSGAGGVYLGASNSNTLQVGNGTVTVAGTMNATTFSGPLTGNVTGNVSGTAATVTGAAQTSITSVGTLTGLTIGGAGSNRFITINAPTGYYAIQYFAINGTNKWHYELNPAGTRWSLVESGVAERIGVTSTGATFSGTVTATTFSGGLASSNLTGQTGMWSSVNRPGPYRLYRRDNDSDFSVQTYWTGTRWRLYGYNGDSAHADTHVGYADSAGSASTADSASTAGFASTVGSGSGGIPYPGATIGGGAPNGIGFRWASPYVNCTVDNVISAAAANFSDKRIKTNIQTLTNGMELVRQLRCVTYNPLDVIGFEEETFEPIIGDLDPYDEMIGFVADEVQEVYANAIHGEGNRLKSIDSVQLLSMAVSAIQDLDARLQELDARLQQLEESNV
jgi:hypothetical protein